MRSLKDKYQSTKLHQSWALILGATILLIFRYITEEIWLGAITISFGGYAVANVRQHQIYNNDIGVGVDEQ